MATLPELVPNGDGTVDGGVIGLTSSTAPWWDDMDSGSGAPSDNTGLATATDFTGNVIFFDMDDMPSDFASMSFLVLHVRAARDPNFSPGPASDGYNIRCRAFESNETTELSSTPSFLSIIVTSPSFSTFNFALTGITPGSKSIWNGFRVLVETLHSQSKGPDLVRTEISEVWATGLYNVAAGGVKTLALTGHGL